MPWCYDLWPSDFIMKKDILRGGNMQTSGIVNPLKSKKKKLFAFKTGQTDMAIPKYMCPSPQNFVKKKLVTEICTR